MVKNPPTNAGDTRDMGSVLGSGRSPWVGKWQPTPVCCLENSIDRGAWQAPWGSQRVGHGWAHRTAHVCPDASKHISALKKGSHYDFQAGVELISEVYGNGQRWYFIFGTQDNYMLLLKFSGQGTKHPEMCHSVWHEEGLLLLLSS